LPATEVADLQRQAARLQASVREAGALALSMFKTPMKNWTKGAALSPVSDADIAVDNLLRERLRDDGIAWLSEETIDDQVRLKARYVWIVDPIDGTRAYIAGLPDWSVSAALVDNGRPTAACLFAPVSAEFYTAVVGEGARRNGVAIAASTGSGLAQARVAGPKKLLERLQAAAPPFTVMPRTHSLALRIARVADGSFEAAFAGGNSHDWDLAAADLLVHEAGGALTPFGGGTVTYNCSVPRHGMLVAAGKERHAALLEIIREERLAST
jgi:myo-inositol-1(or 4)-monophosphatase